MKRPVLVTVISIFTVVAGVFAVGIGSMMLANRNDIEFLAKADATTNDVTAIGIYLLVVGALAVIAGVGLWRGSRVMRALVGVIEVAQIGGAVYTLVKLGDDQRAGAIGSIIGALIVLYFLFGTAKAKAFFAR